MDSRFLFCLPSNVHAFSNAHNFATFVKLFRILLHWQVPEQIGINKQTKFRIFPLSSDSKMRFRLLEKTPFELNPLVPSVHGFHLLMEFERHLSERIETTFTSCVEYQGRMRLGARTSVTSHHSYPDTRYLKNIKGDVKHKFQKYSVDKHKV